MLYPSFLRGTLDIYQYPTPLWRTGLWHEDSYQGGGDCVSLQSVYNYDSPFYNGLRKKIILLKIKYFIKTNTCLLWGGVVLAVTHFLSYMGTQVQSPSPEGGIKQINVILKREKKSLTVLSCFCTRLQQRFCFQQNLFSLFKLAPVRIQGTPVRITSLPCWSLLPIRHSVHLWVLQLQEWGLVWFGLVFTKEAPQCGSLWFAGVAFPNEIKDLFLSLSTSEVSRFLS